MIHHVFEVDNFVLLNAKMNRKNAIFLFHFKTFHCNTALLNSCRLSDMLWMASCNSGKQVAAALGSLLPLFRLKVYTNSLKDSKVRPAK